MIVRSVDFTPPMPGSVISLEVCLSLTSRTTSPFWRSCSMTAFLVSASSVPLDCDPIASTAFQAKVDMPQVLLATRPSPWYRRP